MVVTGDPSQVDLPGNVRSGLADALRRLENVDGVGISRLGVGDLKLILARELCAPLVFTTFLSPVKQSQLRRNQV
ncbi:MAG: PhoH family protein, partial [Candidatus Poseidoniia archaeon]